MPPSLARTSLAPPDRLSTRTSSAFVDRAGGWWLLAWMLVLAALAWRARRMGGRIAERVTETARLRPGPALLGGTVEVDGGSEPAVEITIHQRGRERRHKNTYSVEWREERRDVEVRPFWLRLDGGGRVRVEPGPDVELLDRLEEPFPQKSHDQRGRRARLTDGEHAFIEGVLARVGGDPVASGPYRGGASEFILRPARGRKLFISSEPLEGRYRRRAKVHLGWAAGGLVVLAIVQLLMGATFHALEARGERVVARVTNLSTYVTRHKNRTTTHYVVLATASGRQLKDETTWWRFQRLRFAQEIEWTVDPRDPDRHQIGWGEVGISSARAVFIGLFLIALLVGHPITYFATRPWYERKRVVDTVPGRLAVG